MSGDPVRDTQDCVSEVVTLTGGSCLTSWSTNRDLSHDIKGKLNPGVRSLLCIFNPREDIPSGSCFQIPEITSCVYVIIGSLIPELLVDTEPFLHAQK